MLAPENALLALESMKALCRARFLKPPNRTPSVDRDEPPDADPSTDIKPLHLRPRGHRTTLLTNEPEGGHWQDMGIFQCYWTRTVRLRRPRITRLQFATLSHSQQR